MSYLKSLQICASGLSAQRLRINLISNNLANINTTRTPEGGPYQKKVPIFEATPINSSFQDELNLHMEDNLSEVNVVELVRDKRPPLLEYDPGHPDANIDGYVEKPNISILEEMVDLMEASRSYEANVKAANATKNMILKALEIGK
jgi:flagellar basal-body rod protein FlgC